MFLERLITWDLKFECLGNIFFELFLSDLEEKITFAAYERHAKGKSETSLSCQKIYLLCPVSHEKRNYNLTLDNFSLSSQQLVPNYFLYPSKGSDVHPRFWPSCDQINTPPRLAAIWRSLRSVQSRAWEKKDCRELLEVHRNVIDVKSTAFFMILLASEVSFVTLHMRRHKGCSNSIHKKMQYKNGVTVLVYASAGS